MLEPLLERIQHDSPEVVRFVYGLYERFAGSNCFLMAAAIAYYGVFSLFPLLLVSVAVVGFILPASQVHQQVEDLVRLYVPGSAEFLTENLRDLVRVRGQVGIVGVVALLWVSSAVFNAITRTMNEIWGTMHANPFWRTRLVGILMVLLLGALIVLSLGMTTAYQVVQTYESEMMQRWGVHPLIDAIPWQMAGRVLPIVITFTVFTVIYRFFPAEHLRFGDVWLGAAVATLAFEFAKAAFGAYLRSAAHFQLIHGSLTTLIFLLLWIYIGTIILLFGAVFNVHLRHWRSERR